MIGKIIKGIGGFYYIKSGNAIHTLKARGVFRIRGGKPVIGDIVDFSEDGGFIEKIHTRKNEFIRPAVSNMDQLAMVFAPTMPSPDLLLVDRLLIQAEAAGIDIFVVLNKSELVEQTIIEEFKEQYKLYDFISCSVYENKAIDDFKNRLIGKDTFLAGQSGVGKSSLVNAAFPDFTAEVGKISDKSERGKHTTRHVEIMPLPEGDGNIVDTPGFSSFECDIDLIEIDKYYRDFKPFIKECRFVGCSHTHEPDCAVKSQVGKEISKKRYDRYVVLYKEQQERRKKQYD